jgi:hypothetical protein
MYMQNMPRKAAFAFVLMTILLYGCAQAATPVPTPAPTNTSAPSATSAPTSTPSPSQTPLPTLTATSAPTRTSPLPTATVPVPDEALKYLNGVQIVKIDTFDGPMLGKDWYNSALVSNQAGGLVVTGADWADLYPKHSFYEGLGFIIDFSFARDTKFEVFFANGLINTNALKVFSIYIEENRARSNLWAGKSALGGAILPGNLVLQPDTNYSLMLAIIPNGEFLAVIWKPADPSKNIFYRERIGKSWSSLTWRMGFAINGGTLGLDNYREFQFDTAK